MDVILNKKAFKGLESAPKNAKNAFFTWVEILENYGWLAAKRIPGFHDEKLKGSRQGQRSIRLNRAWRAYYIIALNGDLELIEVIEVNKHDYKVKK